MGDLLEMQAACADENVRNSNLNPAITRRVQASTLAQDQINCHCNIDCYTVQCAPDSRLSHL